VIAHAPHDSPLALARSSQRTAHPVVVFVCPDAHAALACAREADDTLTGRLGVMGTQPEHWYFPGRDHIFFAVETDIHHRSLRALTLPSLHPACANGSPANATSRSPASRRCPTPSSLRHNQTQ